MKSGNTVVDGMHKINFEGNIIPHSWYQHPDLRTPAGNLNLPAVIILADIVYWYRPVLIRDEQTGNIVEVRRRFKYHRLYKDYKLWGQHLGLTKRQVSDAINFLKRKKIITVEITPFKFDSGLIVGTVVFIEPILKAIEKLTFDVTHLTINSDPLQPIAPGEKGVTIKRDPPSDKTRSPQRLSAAPPTLNSDLYTEKTAQNTKDTQQQDETGNSEQSAPLARVVVAPISSQTAANAARNDPPTSELKAQLEARMKALRVSPPTRKTFLATDDEEKLKSLSFQLDCLPDRAPYKVSAAATLVKAFNEEWEAPPSYYDRIEAEQRRNQARANQEAQERKRREEEKSKRAEDARAAAEGAELDIYFEHLPAEVQAQIEADARAKLGVLGNLGRGQVALQQFRRAGTKLFLAELKAGEVIKYGGRADESEDLENESREGRRAAG